MYFVYGIHSGNRHSLWQHLVVVLVGGGIALVVVVG